MFTRKYKAAMKQDQDKMSTKKIFENSESKKTFQTGLKYLALSLPLLFASPVIVTVGFKSLNRGNGYFVLILGCVLIMLTIALVIQAFRLLLKALFNR
jgi:hypothetical protein